MKKRTRIFWGISLFALPLHAAAASSFSAEAASLPRDAAYVFASPLRLSSYGSPVIPVAGAALGVTIAYDGQIRDRLVHLRDWSGQRSFRQAGNVLQMSGLVVGSGLMAYGKAKDDDQAFDNGWLQFEGAATAASTGYFLKWVIGRGRPGADDPDHFKPFTSNASFPSGHALIAFTAAEITSQEYPSWWVRGPSFLVATAVGVSRVAADQHWMGDVLGGALLGTGIGHALYKVHHRPSKDWHLLAVGNGAALVCAF